jgi:uncharacterized membrane protein
MMNDATKKNLVPILVLVLLTAGYAALVIGGAPQLPERVAIHFGADGSANGWANRNQATFIFETLTIGPVIFLILALVMRLMPAGAFNLPNRDYWLAPERRTQTIAAISRQLIWMGCLMVVFLAGVYWLTIEANRLTPPHLPMNLFWPLVLGFLAATGVWTTLFLLRFKKPSA